MEFKESLVREILGGILQGDGYVGGRMASSHPGAKPPYPEPFASYAQSLSRLVVKEGIPTDERREQIIEEVIADLKDPDTSDAFGLVLTED